MIQARASDWVLRLRVSSDVPHGNSLKNVSNSAWNFAGSLMYGAWLPPAMITFLPVLTERTSRSACV